MRYKALARELSAFANARNSSLFLRGVLFANNELYKPFLLNSLAKGVSGKNEQPTQTLWRGAQCSASASRPALRLDMRNVVHTSCLSRHYYSLLLLRFFCTLMRSRWNKNSTWSRCPKNLCGPCS